LRSNAAEYSVQSQLVGHFGLRENAFGVTPDPRFLFLSQTHREALASLVNGIDCGFGFQVLVAQPGMGKTTLLFNFLERFRTTAHTAFLFQPQPNPVELLQSVLLELGTNSEETSMRKLSEQLNQVLTRSAAEDKRVIVVIDEAQNLDFTVLEGLRQLSNFETASSKLMQIVLAGQPQLAKRLALPEQEQLMQRISAFGRLSPLALNETQTYIDHRLATAGYQGGHLFTQGAIRSIWDHSRGVPRNINTLCFNAMLLGFAEHAKSIDGRIVEDAARDLDLNRVLADVYQMESPKPLSGGDRKFPPMRETSLPETVAAVPQAMPAATVQPAAALASISKGLMTVTPVPQSGDVNSAVTGENIPSPAVTARPQISLVVDEQKTAPVAKSNPPTQTLSKVAPTLPTAQTSKPKAVEAPANSANAPQLKASTPTQSNTTAVPPSKSVPPGKNSPPKKAEEPVRAEREPAAATAALNKKKITEKRSESRIWWIKALALTAAIGVLAFVLGEEFTAQRPGQVQANAAGGSAVTQTGSGDSAPGDTSSSNDTPSPQPKNTSESRAARNADPDGGNDVTVRKFPSESDSALENLGKTRKLETIFFEQDSALIGAQYGAYLRRIADALAENPGASAIIEGHTDNTGPEGYNQELSSRRAIEVRNALVDELHVSTTRLTAVGAGANSPVQPNTSSSGRAYNRRVEVRMVHLDE
jgi:type II secretory pathway predicted ATPase ExeA/outer membrane protein OmpA-like peptidoglycan-associated protein